MSQKDVTYRHIVLQDKYDKISLFALWYNDYDSALHFFNFIEEYYEKKNEYRNISVDFFNTNNTYELIINIIVGDNKFNTSISGIDPIHIDDLVNTIETYPYIVILTGYTDENGTDHITKGCSYGVAHIKINNKTMKSKNQKKYPHRLLNAITK